MELLNIKMSLKPLRPALANSRCQGLLYQALLHSNPAKKNRAKFFFQKKWETKQKAESADKGSDYSGWRNG